jgi:hypothetical protein
MVVPPQLVTCKIKLSLDNKAVYTTQLGLLQGVLAIIKTTKYPNNFPLFDDVKT